MATQISGNNQPVFTDIDPNFIRSPKTSDLLLLKDEKAIRASVHNLLSTAFGERLFQPNIGGSLRPLLFEPIDAITAMEMRDRVLKTLLDNEPRIADVLVDIVSLADENTYNVTVEYSINGIGRADRINLVLQRIR
jgi:hypothetical protein